MATTYGQSFLDSVANNKNSLSRAYGMGHASAAYNP